MVYKIYRGLDTHKDALLDNAHTIAGATWKANKYADQYQTFPITVSISHTMLGLLSLLHCQFLALNV